MYNHNFSWLEMSLSGLESSKISQAKSGKKLWKKTRKVLLKTVESNKKRMLDCEWTVIWQIVISSWMRVFKSTAFLSSFTCSIFQLLKSIYLLNEFSSDFPFFLNFSCYLFLSGFHYSSSYIVSILTISYVVLFLFNRINLFEFWTRTVSTI